MRAVGPSVIGLLVIGVALAGAALMAAGCDPVPPPSMVPHLEPTIAPSAPPVDVATLRTLSPTVGPSAVARVEDKAGAHTPSHAGYRINSPGYRFPAAGRPGPGYAIKLAGKPGTRARSEATADPEYRRDG